MLNEYKKRGQKANMVKDLFGCHNYYPYLCREFWDEYSLFLLKNQE